MKKEELKKEIENLIEKNKNEISVIDVIKDVLFKDTFRYVDKRVCKDIDKTIKSRCGVISTTVVMTTPHLYLSVDVQLNKDYSYHFNVGNICSIFRYINHEERYIDTDKCAKEISRIKASCKDSIGDCEAALEVFNVVVDEYNSLMFALRDLLVKSPVILHSRLNDHARYLLNVE